MNSTITKNRILLLGLIGLIGAIGMFTGDMLLYFTTAEYDASTGINAYANIMATVPTIRLYIGSLLGPFCGFLYYLGFTQLFHTIPGSKVSKLVFVLYALGWIIGSAFHSQFGALGLAMKNNIDASPIIEFVGFFGAISMLLFFIASLLLAILIMTKKNLYPRWFVLLTPIVMILVTFIQLPQPFSIIILGGFSNLMFIPFFIVSTYLLWKKAKKTTFCISKQINLF